MDTAWIQYGYSMDTVWTQYGYSMDTTIITAIVQLLRSVVEAEREFIGLCFPEWMGGIQKTPLKNGLRQRSNMSCECRGRFATKLFVSVRYL
jgi:hypothetical protein